MNMSILEDNPELPALPSKVSEAEVIEFKTNTAPASAKDRPDWWVGGGDYREAVAQLLSRRVSEEITDGEPFSYAENGLLRSSRK